MDTLGRHLLVEYYGCSFQALNDLQHIEQSMQGAALAADATIVTSTFHRFSPQGVSGVVVIQESHLSIHTWPETGYAAVDFYTCGDGKPHQAHAFLMEKLGATHAELIEVERGLMHEPSSLRLKQHMVDENGQSTRPTKATA